MSQPLYDENEMWHGHSDLYMNKLEEILNTSGCSDIGYFLEVDLRYLDNGKEKRKKVPFVLKLNLFLKLIIVIIRKR